MEACHSQLGHLPEQNVLQIYAGISKRLHHLVVHRGAVGESQAAQLRQLRHKAQPFRLLDIVGPHCQPPQVTAVAKQRHHVVLVEETVVHHCQILQGYKMAPGAAMRSGKLDSNQLHAREVGTTISDQFHVRHSEAAPDQVEGVEGEEGEGRGTGGEGCQQSAHLRAGFQELQRDSFKLPTFGQS